MKRLLLALTAAFGVLGALGHGGPEYPWQRIPMFDLWFGLLGCAALILFSEALGKFFLLRREDYYDRP